MKVFIVFKDQTVYGVYMSLEAATEQAVKGSSNVLFKGLDFHIEEHTVTE
tara:strand:- start:68 stop:217 length:150 start_codon:yes stop_codon:yes gene_type:complete